MNSAPKSATVAGVLGILLGAFGVHDWYLGREKPAKRHVTLLVAGVVAFALSLAARALISAMTQLTWANTLNSIATTLRVLAWIMLLADVVWGIIEGILLLVQGDANLAAQGYTVATKTDDTQANVATTNISAMPSTPDNTAPSDATPRPRVELPPAPTLAEQASNANTTPQPIVFRASDITNPTAAQPVNQPLGSKNVPMAPLTVTGKDGKATINPTVLRKLLFAAVIIIAVVVGVVFIKNSIDSVLAAGYRETYLAAKELAPRITVAHQSKGCRYVVDFVDAVMIDKGSYNEYIKTCRDLASGVKPLVDKLGETTALDWNAELQQQYQEFRELYNDDFPEDNGLAENLEIYQTWHNFLVAESLLSVDDPESEYQELADTLRESGNLTVAKYGEEWLSRQLAYLHNYHEYWDTSYTAEDKEEKRLALETERAELVDWTKDHQPKITELVRIFVPDTEPMYASFTKLYDMIKTAYEQHYDRKSDDCNVAGSKVFCS